MATKKTSTTVEADQLLTIGEVAALAGVSKATISRACTSGEMACVRFASRVVRIPLSALEEFIRRGGVQLTASNRARRARRQPQRG